MNTTDCQFSPPSTPISHSIATDAGRFWSQSSERPWIRDLSHWRGRGRWADDQLWSAMGRHHLAMFQELRRLARHTTPVRTMLEWGPGGGPNAVAFVHSVERFYGVDISPANLAECGRQLQSTAAAKWNPILIDPATPASCLEQISHPIDFFLSTAVFQHFPGKAYGIEVMRIAQRLLASPGLALIQIRYDDGSDALRPKESDYAKNAVTFTSYRIDEFWQIAADTGFVPLSVTLSPTDCYATYWLCKG